ncbi:MAG: hypothetical protein IOD12_12990 [Silvanigrellales bacterium]|nr:hypothetical protein [Silvanigrellales bacterium]
MGRHTFHNTPPSCLRSSRWASLSTTLLWLAVPGQAWSQRLHELSELIPPEKPQYETLVSQDGDHLLVAKVRYGEGTAVRHPAVARLVGLDLPLEILFLDVLVPSPQTIRVPALLPGESHAEGLPRLRAQLLQELARDLDFGPKTPFRIRIRQAQGFAATNVVLSPREQWDALAPRCLQDEWLGLARVRPSADISRRLTWGALVAALRGLQGPAEESATPSTVGTPSTPFFNAGEFVCVALEDLSPSQTPSDP